MKNKKTVIVKIDWEKQEVLYENLDAIVSYFIEKNLDFELLLIDANSYVIDSHINTIVNRYIADCKKKTPPLGVDRRFVCEFIENFMKYVKKETGSALIVRSPDDTPIDLIAPNGKGFCADLPSKTFSREKMEDLLFLGPDYVMGGLPLDVLFNYVLSPFYFFLYDNDLFDNDKLSDLTNYKYGLH